MAAGALGGPSLEIIAPTFVGLKSKTADNTYTTGWIAHIGFGQ